MSARLRGRHRRADLPAMLAALDEAVEPAGRAGRRPAVLRPGPRGRRPGPGSGCGSPASTPWSRSPARPAAASPRCSTRCPGPTSSPVGVRRPTTSKAYASVWGARRRRAAGALARRAAPADDAGGTGRACARRSSASSTAWCCSTCPTTTRPSSSTSSRSTGWWSWSTCWSGSSTRRSTPTQVLHERYLRRLARHDAVMVVVLNQVDTVNPFAAAECADDLRRLLDDDGLRRVACRHRPRPAPGPASTRCGPCSRTRWPSAEPATTGWSPTSRTSSRRARASGVGGGADGRRRGRAQPAGRGARGLGRACR